MAKITLKYDPKNKQAQNLIELIKTISCVKIQKSGMEEAMEDIKAGRINSYSSVDDMFISILGKNYVSSKNNK